MTYDVCLKRPSDLEETQKRPRRNSEESLQKILNDDLEAKPKLKANQLAISSDNPLVTPVHRQFETLFIFREMKNCLSSFTLAMMKFTKIGELMLYPQAVRWLELLAWLLMITHLGLVSLIKKVSNFRCDLSFFERSYSKEVFRKKFFQCKDQLSQFRATKVSQIWELTFHQKSLRPDSRSNTMQHDASSNTIPEHAPAGA